MCSIRLDVRAEPRVPHDARPHRHAQIISLSIKLAACLPGFPYLPNVMAYELGAGVLLMEGLVLPCACLVRPAALR
jgi:hypothetical protein